MNSDLGKTLISGASKQFGQDEEKTTNALSTALRLILGVMKNNASTPDGETGLLKALGNDKHSGGILDNLGSVLGGGGVDQDVLDDGAGILVMGALGKETRKKGISDQNGIGDLLGGMLGGASKDQQSLVSKLLDADGDGSIIDDVAGMLLGGNKQKGGIGSLLGGLFGSK